MRALTRKLGRELWHNAGTMLSVVAIIAIGTGCFIGMSSAVRILSVSQAAYYRAYRFADFWVTVKKAPLTAVEQLAEIDGIEEWQARIVFDVILNVPGETRPLTGRLISMPVRNGRRPLNDMCLIRGTSFSDDRSEEVILSEAFAREHDLSPGDHVELILNRKRESFVIVGTAISPEYVYMVRGEGDLIPDPKHFGILYLPEAYARDVLDFRDACNQVTGRFVPGAEKRADAILNRVERVLDPYGVLATTPRERHASHRFLTDEIRGGRVTSKMIPAIFLAVAALVLNVLMSRLAERQRTTIGTLKAVGYSDRGILWHFMGFGLVVGIAGGVAGNILGIGLASAMVEMYKGFYQFPSFVYEVYPDLLLIGMLISVSFAVAGTAKGVWTVLHLQPAEAMRAKPPERGGAILLERLPWLWSRLGFRSQLALRNLMRNRTRTITGVLSTALATALIASSLIMHDSMWFLVDFQFDRLTHSDVDLGLHDEQSAAVLNEARELPGVDYAEPMLSVVCDLRHGPCNRRLGVTGLAATRRLTTPLQADLQPIKIPERGLVLTRKLAELLDANPGDHLELTPVRGRRDTVDVYVASVVDSYIGLSCYANLDYLSSLVGESRAVNGLQLLVNPAETAALFHSIKDLPAAQGLSVRSDVRASIEDTLVHTMTATIGIIIVFAGMIAFGSILNNSLVDIGDQLRDISTFRVLGYGPRQIAGIFFRQAMFTFVLGVALAAPLTWGLSQFWSAAMDTELFRIHIAFRLPVLAQALLAVVAFVLLAQVLVYRQIRRLDWLEGIKVKE
ncbi:MAG: ABC transporter permease [Phycisphaerae bacterium]|jgi:putative ABC transport system permease protein